MDFEDLPNDRVDIQHRRIGDEVYVKKADVIYFLDAAIENMHADTDLHAPCASIAEAAIIAMQTIREELLGRDPEWTSDGPPVLAGRVPTLNELKSLAAAFMENGVAHHSGNGDSQPYTAALEDYRKMEPQTKDAFGEAVVLRTYALTRVYARILADMKSAAPKDGDPGDGRGSQVR